MESGVPESRCFLPFLVGSKKLVECIHCHKLIYPGEEVCCSVRGCQGVYHKICAKESLKMSNPKKIPVSAAYRLQWQCVCCTISSHDKCSPWLDVVIHLKDKPGKAICWRHPTNWRLVIDGAQSEQRLWDMKFKGMNNFYMCEIRKDFTIDATFKGNASLFLNHSCNPNCVLENWLVLMILLFFFY
ncbi:histone-lysine N-methyltransferase ASHR3-like isoform X3 [Durio zibethinus]|uniref:Histone-lysine N-methyltransferase ASHR3-like isoform X3 n=1 Tax=Durio zibethinus TaxID=66656 RepID=A0A6P5Z9N8_DURZI|nr:histone-lysine N-methyltransferase ASHR3-like isoform X3 [Durio zibethinus]